MAYPPASIAADKAPGVPTSNTEHPDHHNALAAGVNDIVAELGSNPSGAADDVTSRLDTLDSEVVRSSSVDSFERLTQAAYDALSPPDPTTVYFIVG